MSENDMSQRPSSFFLENFLTGIAEAIALSDGPASDAVDVNDSAAVCMFYEAPRVG